MARPRIELIVALRRTAERLAGGAAYQWGHYGQCKCGHVAQTLTGLGPAEIHRMAQQGGADWGTQAEEYCDTSGLRIDRVIRTMLAAGLDLDDIIRLENLDDPRVLAALPGGTRHLARNAREDAVLYLRTWAALLERELERIDGAVA